MWRQAVLFQLSRISLFHCCAIAPWSPLLFLHLSLCTASQVNRPPINTGNPCPLYFMTIGSFQVSSLDASCQTWRKDARRSSNNEERKPENKIHFTHFVVLLLYLSENFSRLCGNFNVRHCTSTEGSCSKQITLTPFDFAGLRYMKYRWPMAECQYHFCTFRLS